MELKEQMDAIGKMLDTCLEYGMEVQVIYYSLNKMKQDPKLTPAEAFALSITELVK